MQDLQADLPLFRLHGCRDQAVFCRLAAAAQFRPERRQPALPVGRDATGNHQPRSTPRPGGKISGQALKTVFGFFQTRVHGTHQDTVF